MSSEAQEVGAEVVAASADDPGQEAGMRAKWEELRAKFEELCRELNMDRQTEELAYKKFIEVSQSYSIEGDPLQWFCCALFSACRQSSTPTVSGQDAVVMGNCVSLNNLLRSCHMSIYEFKTKIKQWCDMAKLSQEFKKQIEELERKFSITFTLYKNYRNIFEKVFHCPPNEKKNTKFSALHSSHANKCSYIKLNDICWRLFLCAKNQKPTTTVDLVTSYHLMICCIDLVYANVLAEKRTDLIRPDFEGVPSNWNTPEFSESQAKQHCILAYFCDMIKDAKAMKATVFNKIMQAFFQANTIYGQKDTLLGLVSNENFERNLKSLNISYEQYVLSVGEFDERILAAYPMDVGDHTNLHDQALRPPATPLTRKQDLQPQQAEQKFEPVASATENVKHLFAFTRITEPTEFVKQAGEESIGKMMDTLTQLEQKFLDKHPIRSEAVNRFRLAKSIYFYILDHILRAEVSKKTEIKPTTVLQRLLGQHTLNVTLLACCVELVLEAYNTELKFPWILDCFNIKAFEFIKIIELVVRHGSQEGRLNLTRPLIKHLNMIEETCLERLTWERDSPLWDAIRRGPNSLPTCKEVTTDTAAGPLQIFLRKLYNLGWLRIKNFCGELKLHDEKQKIWTIFEHSITHKSELMKDRHLDQIIMCAIYIYIRVTKMTETKFSDIMRAYRTQPQSVNSVYREVLISINEDGERKNKDIIYFYNNKYVPEMSDFSIQYSEDNVDKKDLLTSPHPVERHVQPKKLTQNHSLYVQQMPKSEIQQSPNQLVYKFCSSPAKDLHRMNEKVRGGGLKRHLHFNDDVDEKRVRELPSHLNQIKTVMDDRENERK